MRRFILTACVALAACGSGGGAPPTVPPADDGSQPSQPAQPSQPGAPGATLSPPVTVSGTPAPPPSCELGRAADPPDAALAPERTLSPVWTLAPQDGWFLGFEGVGDDDGDVYWAEWAAGGGGSAIASATRDGVRRWRTELDAPGASPWLVAAGRVLAAVGADVGFPDRVEALDATTGAVAWTLDVAAVAAPLVPADRGAPRPGVRVDHPSVLDGVATLPVAVVDGPGYVWPGLLRVELATGRVVELRAIATDLTIWIPGEPVVAGGETFAEVRPTQTTAALLGFGPDGAPVVARPLRSEDNLWTLAASDRFLFETGRDEASGAGFVQWSALDGTPRGRLAAESWGANLVARDAAALLWDRGRLTRVDLDRCAIAWDRTIVRAPPADRYTRYDVVGTPPILTSAGGLLVIAQLQRLERVGAPTGEGAWVVEVAADGTEAFRGRLPDGDLYGGGAALHRGRLVTVAGPDPYEQRLVAFDLAAQEPAPSGWVTRDGGMSRERRAR